MKNGSKKQGVVTAANYDHPGRPRYEMKFPRSAEWTFTQLMAANGVNTDKGSKNFGKGDNCTMLTLRKNLKHDMFRADGGRKATSLVVEVKGVTAEPDSDSGLGRRATLYRMRSVAAKDHSADKVTAPKASRKAKAPKVSVAAVIAEAKAILAEPASTVVIAPAPEVAPVPVPTVETAPIAENPTPAPASEVEVKLANETPIETVVAPENTPAPEATAVVVPAAANAGIPA